jgi:hypothetical protein
MDTVNLQSLEGEELEKWKKAIEDQTGYKFTDVVENEPIMIAEDYFPQYAEELAEDLGLVDRNRAWPISCIDWDRASDELQYDYTSVQVDGTDYYFRAF